MSDQEQQRTDGGQRKKETYESVDWKEIDDGLRLRDRKEYIWFTVVGVWTVAFMYDQVHRFILDVEQASFPVVIPGIVNRSFSVSHVDWLFSLTILLLVYYAVVPLYENPRLTKHYWKEFRKNKAAVISLLFLITIFLVGVIGRRVLPSPEPTPGKESLPPVGMSIEGYATGVDCPADPSAEMCHGSWAHPLGTTTSGEDIMIASIHGMEVTMQVGLIATAISIGIATAVGITAAYSGGLVDEVLMRYVDLMMTFPTFFLFLLLAYLLGGDLLLLILIFGFFGWGSTARITRAEALQRVEMPYIQAAKNAGASSVWIIRRHILPNVTNTVITAATLAIPGIILAEAAFSFIGLGDPTVYSWGQLIADGQDELSRAWWISTIPGFFLFFTILAFNFLGDALRDALDPRHGGAEK